METYNIAIIGGGPAGIMSAISAGTLSSKVILINSNERPGKKLLITGGGRCNFTHLGKPEEILSYYGKNQNFLKHSLYSFPPEKVIDFFNTIGVESKKEKDGCVFTKNDKADDLLQALLKKINLSGIILENNSVVTRVKHLNGKFQIITQKGKIHAHKVIIATGGISYPLTGSTGAGYSFAKSFGHNIIKPKPTLIPLTLKESYFRSLSGLSINNICIKIPKQNKNKCFHGDLLFTHKGLSGPVALDLSSEIDEIIDGSKKYVEISIDFLPDLEENQLDKICLDIITKHPHKSFRVLLDEFLPKSFLETIYNINGFDGLVNLKELDKKQRTKLIKIIKNYPLTISGTSPIEIAIVTRGGIDTKEIDNKTMESKLMNGLYFAGEVIDVDGKCGGYNLQLCWATGRLSGISAAKSLLL